MLTPLLLINRIAQLVPPRTHRHRYYGVLTPNSPQRGVVTAMVQVAVPSPQVVVSCPAVALPGSGAPTKPQATPKPRPPSHYLWAALIARIFEVLQLICPKCGGLMRSIAFIMFSDDTQKILEHIGVEPEARVLPRHAGHRCRKMRVCIQTISTLLGEFAALGKWSR